MSFRAQILDCFGVLKGENSKEISKLNSERLISSGRLLQRFLLAEIYLANVFTYTSENMTTDIYASNKSKIFHCTFISFHFIG